MAVAAVELRDHALLGPIAAGAGQFRAVLSEGPAKGGATGLAASEELVEGVQIHELPEFGFGEGAAELGEGRGG